ncbi:MAG: pilus assembly protein PilM [Candidatus Omnitrophica bacterium]|nr:pilus assembly protein PilM [Candidatus Omnitrophota bacterium]
MTFPILYRLHKIVDELPLFTLKDILVISIDETCVKLVEVNVGGLRPVIQNFAIVNIEDTEGSSDDPAAAVIATIKKAYERGGFKGKNIFTLSMSGSVFLRKISLPKIPINELEAAIRWEAGNHIPFNIDTAYFDWEFLTSVKMRDGVVNDEYMIAATNRNVVDNLIAIFKRLNLNLICVGLPAFALRNIVRSSDQFKLDENTSIIDIGAKKTNIVIFKGKVLCFAREIPFGYSTLDDILRNELHMEFDRLEPAQIENCIKIIKSKYDVMSDLSSREEIVPGITNQRIYGSFTSFLDRLVADMRRSFEYIKEQVGSLVIDKIVISGIGVRMVNIDRYIERNFGVTTEPIQAHNVFRFDQSINTEVFEHNFQELALSIGCATGGLKQINFMPVSYLEKRRDIIYAAVLSLTLVFFLFIGVILGIQSGLKVGKIEKTLRQENKMIEAVRPQISTLQNLCNTYLEKRKVFDVINENRILLSRVLQDISIKIPKTIAVKSIKLNDTLLTIEGYVFEEQDESQNKENVLVDFIILMNDSRYVSRASLVLSESGKDFDVPHNFFRVSCLLKTASDFLE